MDFKKQFETETGYPSFDECSEKYDRDGKIIEDVLDYEKTYAYMMMYAGWLEKRAKDSTKWIDAIKEKPDTVRDVLVCVKLTIDKHITYHNIIGFYDDVWQDGFENIETENTKVVAWTELPEIPKFPI